LLAAFVDGLAPDLLAASVAYRLRGRTSRESLAEVMASAQNRGADTLLLSSEEFDRVRPEDRTRLEDVLGDTDVTLVLTITRPVHRWCAGWQTLVRHGLPHYPVEGTEHVREFAALRPGRLAEILDLIPAQRCLIRLVRSSPPEPNLAADLADAIGLPTVDRDFDAPVLNPSLGVDTEVVLRINRAGLGMGTDRAGREALRRLKTGDLSYREDPGLAPRYAIPRSVLQAAAAEQDWLRAIAANPQATVLDPHQLLGSWKDATVPDWYATISRREAVVPELDDTADANTLLWRARQELLAYRKRLDVAGDAATEGSAPGPGLGKRGVSSPDRPGSGSR